MQVLYKDEEGFLAVMEVTKAAYIEDEELMEICGPEEDIAVAIDAKSAEKAIDHCIYLRSDFVENTAPVKMQNIQFQPVSGA